MTRIYPAKAIHAHYPLPPSAFVEERCGFIRNPDHPLPPSVPRRRPEMDPLLRLPLTIAFFPFLLSHVSPSHIPFTKLFAFGDSFTDTGNTRSASGPSGFGHVSNPPYGSTFFHHPTNRYSDGRLVIDFIAQSLSLPYLPPYRSLVSASSKPTPSPHGVNFAVAGSTAISHDFFVKNNLTLNITPQSIMTQLSWFKKYLESQGCSGMGPSAQQCRDSLFKDSLIWAGEIGVNDYAYTFGSTISSDTIRKLAIDTVTAFLESLLKRGARYVVVQGLPTAGCLPLTLYLAPENDRDDLGCVKSVNEQNEAHNSVLQARIAGLRKEHPKAVIVYADYWNAYREVMKEPGKYGFRERFKACCGTGEKYNFTPFETCGTKLARMCEKPKEYINWDGVHLTEAMYRVVSEMFLKGNFTHPQLGRLLR
ncbi:hypothetical protein MLD38_027895 [Melastoma candidum]|uniref:Uncharacterized protein n=1 Tax=Melastoma candidum TaxID=119954 RepID=A0ACB9N1K2_9MYRT|nr:hypothetical protein MLD38_027895 [Melastoma candidum]